MKTVDEKIRTLQAIKWYIDSNQETIPHPSEFYMDRFEAYNFVLKYLISENDEELVAFMNEGNIEMTKQQLDMIVEAYELHLLNHATP